MNSTYLTTRHIPWRQVSNKTLNLHALKSNDAKRNKSSVLIVRVSTWPARHLSGLERLWYLPGRWKKNKKTKKQATNGSWIRALQGCLDYKRRYFLSTCALLVGKVTINTWNWFEKKLLYLEECYLHEIIFNLPSVCAVCHLYLEKSWPKDEIRLEIEQFQFLMGKDLVPE